MNRNAAPLSHRGDLRFHRAPEGIGVAVEVNRCGVDFRDELLKDFVGATASNDQSTAFALEILCQGGKANRRGTPGVEVRTNGAPRAIH
jgi:hypothetical protein